MNKLAIAVNEKDHAMGDDATVCVLVEYGDYQCPSCGEAYPVVKKLQKHFGVKLKFIFRNFPLTQVHPLAEPAAEVAEFAAQQGKFWEMHDLLYENQAKLGKKLFAELAETLALPANELATALAQHKYQATVRADFAGGARSGVNGTPSFFIQSERYNSPYDFDGLSEAIESAIKKAE